MRQVEEGLGTAQPYPALIDMLAETCKSGETILDVGCAGGHMYLALRGRVVDLDYTGIDVTPEYIAFAREKFPDIPFSVGDVRDLPYPDGSFDHVLCLFVLVHLAEKDIPKVIRELTRVARKQVVFAGYFAGKRVEGGQTTEGKDFIYDIVGLGELTIDGWNLEVDESEKKEMRVAADLQDVDGVVHAFEYQLPVFSFARLVRK